MRAHQKFPLWRAPMWIMPYSPREYKGASTWRPICPGYPQLQSSVPQNGVPSMKSLEPSTGLTMCTPSLAKTWNGPIQSDLKSVYALARESPGFSRIHDRGRFRARLSRAPPRICLSAKSQRGPATTAPASYQKHAASCRGLLGQTPPGSSPD